MLTHNLLLYKFSGKNDYDAFGNALRNSIVGKIQQTEREKKIAKLKAEQLENQRLNNMVDWNSAAYQSLLNSGEYIQDREGNLSPRSTLLASHQER